MDKKERQVMADMYTAYLDEKISDPNLKPLRMGYKKLKKEVQEHFFIGYDAGYDACLRQFYAPRAREVEK